MTRDVLSHSIVYIHRQVYYIYRGVKNTKITSIKREYKVEVNNAVFYVTSKKPIEIEHLEDIDPELSEFLHTYEISFIIPESKEGYEAYMLSVAPKKPEEKLRKGKITPHTRILGRYADKEFSIKDIVRDFGVTRVPAGKAIQSLLSQDLIEFVREEKNEKFYRAKKPVKADSETA